MTRLYRSITPTHAGPALPPLSRAVRASVQWRMLLMWVIAMLIPTALVVLPMWRMLSGQLDYSVDAASLARQLDLVAIADLQAVYQRQEWLFDYARTIALIVTLLISPALSAMALFAARVAHSTPDAPAPGFAALLGGARTDYGRMMGMLVWAALPLLAVAGIGYGLTTMASNYDKSAVVAADTGVRQAIAIVVTFVLAVLMHASVDAGRAVLALDHRRRSPIFGWLHGCGVIAQRPLATLGRYGAITVVGLALAAALGYVRLHLPGGGWPAFIGALVLTQIIVVIIGAMRIARLFALVAIAEPLIRPVPLTASAAPAPAASASAS